MEVDQILMDLPSPSPRTPSSAPPNHTRKLQLTPIHHDEHLENDLRGIQKEEKQLKVSLSLGEIFEFKNFLLLILGTSFSTDGQEGKVIT